MSRFINKNLLVLGGSGYTGQQITKTALSRGINVLNVSRNGDFSDPELQSPSNFSGELTVIRGDCNNPQGFSDALSQADAVVHTVGTLIDSSVLKGRSPGEPGTYEHINRDLLINVAKVLEKQNKPKKLVYLSGSYPPPFQPRYLSTKVEAENYLLASKVLQTTILKPGFIYGYQQRKWSIPISIELNIWNKYFNSFYHKCVPENSFMKDFLKNFLADRSVRIEDVANAAIYSAFNDSLNGKLLFNDDIEKNSLYFSNNIARTQAEVDADVKAEKVVQELKLKKEQEEQKRVQEQQSKEVEAEKQRLEQQRKQEEEQARKQQQELEQQKKQQEKLQKEQESKQTQEKKE